MSGKIRTGGDGNNKSALIRQQLEGLTTNQIDSGEVEQAFAKFDPLWNALSPLDQNDLLRLLIERVDSHGDAGVIELHLHPSGIQNLIAQTEDTP